MNLEQMKQLVTNVFGAAPDTIERMTFGHCNVVYGVSIRDKSFIVRTNEDPAVLKDTVNNLRTLAELGLPVPQVITVDLSKQMYSSAYMILPKIPGRDLRFELPEMTKQQMTAVAEQITAFQHKAGGLPDGSGYGWVPVGAQGRFNSWLDLITQSIESHVQHFRHGFSEQDIKSFYQRLEQLKPYLTQVKARCFLDDITIKNVIVYKGELQGIVDFDWVCYGDPLYAISLTQTGIISDIGRQFEAMFYIEELCRLSGTDERQRSIIDFYSVVHGLQFIGFLRKEKQSEHEKRIIHFMKENLRICS